MLSGSCTVGLDSCVSYPAPACTAVRQAGANLTCPPSSWRNGGTLAIRGVGVKLQRELFTGDHSVTESSVGVTVCLPADLYRGDRDTLEVDSKVATISPAVTDHSVTVSME